MPAQEPPIPAAIRDQAIAWFTLAQSGEMSAQEQLHLQQWRQVDPDHERAWQRLAAIPRQLQQQAQLLNTPVARNALQQTRTVNRDRRQLLKAFAGLGLFGASAWQARDSLWLQGALADYHTGTGERQHHTLADGTQIWLNTRTALDVRFSATERQLLLHQGELDILSSQDTAGRPLRVYTAEARLHPLGTRFMVRSDNNGSGTLLAVSSGQVAATPISDVGEQVIHSGQQTRIDRFGVATPQALDPNASAWIDGLIVAQRMRLGDFIAQLSRYHVGILRCDPAVAGLYLTGSFPLSDIERIFTLLEKSLPVHLQRRTPYWITVTARA
ncbi:FecR domain-containing protein [Pseudomonas rubra]|uniref:FecR domain-containing protein n=1 Tax=Pseudomonas rubra TaxID=2942627 RepID=A0ABT5PFZ0_9PSED|nr:FecR domain-containing protein [Pseudomonas rubra]MDD1017236.1 FecR domain-containing protein [Pseudomonas rubra]MDD1041719.1 FecR domain-containing protein [Pseudomonas rubra]MDD1156798.1 FecR domain-containing protein [Pseudomonas rubra]